jgi:polar amino acid transport system permease protein
VNPSDAPLFGYGDQLVAGLVLTLEVSLCSYAIGSVLGLIGAAAKLSRRRSLRLCAGLYTTLVRALPELLLVLLAFYLIAGRVEQFAVFVGLAPVGFSLNPFAVAVTALGFIQGAYITEVLRAAVLAIPRGQREAAQALNLRPLTYLRRIVAPQALRHALGGLGNIWLNATKDASLISVLGIFSDVLKVSSLAAAATKRYVFFYAVAGACFLAITLASMAVLERLRRHLSRAYLA